MGKPFRIRKNCYIYTEPQEDKIMLSIIRVLSSFKGLSGANVVQKTGHDYYSVMVGLWKLIAKGVVDVKQFGRPRIYYLRSKAKKVMHGGA